jgi:hypothetical protein
MPRGRKPGIATVKTSKQEKTQGRLAKAIEAKQAEKVINPPMVAGAIARTERYAQPPDYTPTVEEISDSLRHIHSTLHVFATAMLAFMTRMEGAPVLVKNPTPEMIREVAGITPLGEVKPRKARKPKETEPEVQAVPEVPPEVEAVQTAAVEAATEKVVAKTVTFEEMRGAAVALAGKENGRARLTAILQAEAGVANLSGVPEDKRAAVVKALTEAANG